MSGRNGSQKEKFFVRVGMQDWPLGMVAVRRSPCLGFGLRLSEIDGSCKEKLMSEVWTENVR